jgi:hypothetical protein
MFCKDCGFENTQTALFCKRCGAQQKPDSLKNKQPDLSGKLLTTIGTVTMTGFAVALFALLRMSKGNSPPQFLFIISVLSIVATVAIDALLIRLLLKLHKTPQISDQSHYLPGEPTLNHQNAPQFPAPPIGVASVTEHTTRNFGPIPSMEQKARQ